VLLPPPRSRLFPYTTLFRSKAQWMINMRRGNVPAMIRGAFLRTVFGETEGALEWLTSAFKLTSFTETEERAWLLTHIARLRLERSEEHTSELQSRFDLVCRL